MESFSANSAKSFIGKNVNLHLKDGAVIVNVILVSVLRGSGKNKLIEYTCCVNNDATRVSLRNVAWAELLNQNLLQPAA